MFDMTRRALLALLVLAAAVGTAASQAVWEEIPTNVQPSPRRAYGLAYDEARNVVVLFGGATHSQNFGDTWEWNGVTWRQVAAEGAGPARRHAAAMVYDSARRKTVLFGGRFGAGPAYGDTWEWDGSRWEHVSNAGPSPRFAPCAAYDSLRHRVVLFGGEGVAGDLRDTWEWDGAGWTLVDTGGPPRRRLCMATFDRARGVTVMFGGHDGTTVTEYGDTWEWDGSAWTQVASGGPPPRLGAGFTYDRAGRVSVLFGGGTGPGFFNDTWEWDGDRWASVATSASPSTRNYMSLAYDEARKVAVLFGGHSGGHHDDTWEYSAVRCIDPEPASQGYWHRQCLGVPASEGGIDPGRNGRGPQEPTEPGFVEETMPCADARLEDLGFYGLRTCDGMDADPANDPCQRAEKQLTALILNVCSDRLQDGCEVDVTEQGCSSTTVGDLIDELADLIHGGRCSEAASCAAPVNEGSGLPAGEGGADAAGPGVGGAPEPGSLEVPRSRPSRGDDGDSPRPSRRERLRR